jgi:hypothetical protein
VDTLGGGTGPSGVAIVRLLVDLLSGVSALLRIAGALAGRVSRFRLADTGRDDAPIVTVSCIRSG